MKNLSISKVLAAGIFLLLFSVISHAQLGRGVIAGTVSDPSGAVVPGVAVTLKNLATGTERTVPTNRSGLYRFDFTDVGSYTLRASAQNFTSYEVKDLVLTVGQTVTADIQLELAKGQTQSITVEATGTQLIQTANSEVSGLVDHNTLANLPLEIRDTGSFINLLPGTVPSSLGSVEFNGSTRGSSVNGARGGTGNFILDGFDNNDQGQGGRSHNATGTLPGAIVSISPDAIQEFRVVTDNFSAQYGRQSGFVADAVLKSGGNQMHGSLFEYNRNQAITANDFFSNKTQIKDSLVKNQFGGSLGGPIRKDKTFIFGAVEIQRLRQGSPANLTAVLTPEFINFVKNGAFATFNETDPSGLCIAGRATTDPKTGVVTPGPPCPGAFSSVRTLGPIATQVLQAFPEPTPTFNLRKDSTGAQAFGILYPVNEFGSAVFSDLYQLNETRTSAKLDHTFNSANQVSIVFALDNFPTHDLSIGGTANPGIVPSTTTSRAQNYGFTYTHVFSPTVLNEAKVGYLRHTSAFPRNIAPSIPDISTQFDALSISFGMTAGFPQTFTDNQFQYQDHVAVTRGKHSVNLGVEYRRTRNGSVFASNRDGQFVFNDVESLLTDGVFGDIADGLLGSNLGSIYQATASVNPQTGQKPEYYRGFRANEYSWFAQDDWKVRSRLTVNFGVRYDYFGPPHNFRPGVDSNFYFGPGNVPLTPPSSATRAPNPFFPVNSVAYAREATATFKLRDHNIWNKDLNNFAPRFGMAWDVSGDRKTVIRTGGGVFYDRFWNNLFENIRFNPPLFSTASLGPNTNGVVISPASTPGLYAVPINTALFNDPRFQTVPGPRHMDENIRTPYTEQVFFGIQRQLPANVVLEVNYIGTFGHKLTGVIDLNTFPGRSFPRSVKDPATGLRFSSVRPNPTIGSDNARGNYFNSNFHSLQVTVQKQMSHGLQFSTNYTYAKALDYVSDAFNNRAAAGANGIGIYDVTNRRLDYGRADFDVRHRSVTQFLYDLPVFRGNRWLGGWRTDSIITVQTGLPFAIYNAAADYNRDGKFGTDRPDYFGSGPIANIINQSKSPADGYIPSTDASGKALFGAPVLDPSLNRGLWRDGRLGRNVLSGPGLATIDFSLGKKFRIRERVGLDVQANFFNVFNRANFALPDGNLNDIGSGTFGQSQATFGPRVGQLAARIDF